jgi:pyruvate ferredoxin oxidoreductase delta subunit
MVDDKKSAAPGAAAGRVADQFFNTEASWSDGSGELLVLSTGDWRTERPVFDNDKCNACGFCYIFCPTQRIVDHEDGIHYTAVLDYCKGCGICAKECPKDAIAMVAEADYAEGCKVE